MHLSHLDTPQKFRRGRNRLLASGTIHRQPLPLPPTTTYNFRIWQEGSTICMPSNELNPVPELLQWILVFCTFAPRPDSRHISRRRCLQGAPSSPSFHFLGFDGSASTHCGVDVLKLWYGSANSELPLTLWWLVNLFMWLGEASCLRIARRILWAFHFSENCFKWVRLNVNMNSCCSPVVKGGGKAIPVHIWTGLEG